MEKFEQLKKRNPALTKALESMTKEELLNQYAILDKQKEVYFMQSIALSNYGKLCNKINEAPRLDLIELISNNENIGQLLDSNKMFLDQLNSL